MTTYYYIALNREGIKIKGLIEAEDEKRVISQLKPRGLTIISINKKKAGLFSSSGRKSNSQTRQKDIITFLRQFTTRRNADLVSPSGTKSNSLLIRILRRIKQKDIIVFLRQFATLINAGLPMIQALSIMVEQTPHPILKEKISQLKKDVEAGTPLSEALSKHPRVFSSFSYNMVKAGEMGGMLDVTLTRLATYLESTENVKQKVKAATRYPMFVMIMALGLISAVLLFVLPNMKTLFTESFGAKLPALTQFMLDLSDFAKTRFYLILIFIAALAALYHFIKKSDKGAYTLDEIKLKLPVVGKIIQKISLSKFARTLATLFSSGVPILDSLDMTGKTASNKVIERALKEAKSSLREGETLASPLKKHPIFPPMTVSMISVGEQTGALEEMLNKIADFYDREVETMIESLASILEPLLLGFMGGTIGIVVIAMYLPYFSMFQYIGGE